MRRRAPSEEEFGEELQEHFHELVEDRLARGLDPGRARQQASLTLGNPTRILERYYESFLVNRVRDECARLLRVSRQQRRSPGIFVCGLLSVAIAVGSVTAVLSMAQHTLLAPLPFFNATELRVLQDPADRFLFFPYTTFARVCRQSRGVAAVARWGGPVVFRGTLAQEPILLASENLPDVLALSAIEGRWFTSGDVNQDARPAVVTAAWCARRGEGDGCRLGQGLTINGVRAKIVGIYPSALSESRLTNFTGVVLPLDAMDALQRPSGLDYMGTGSGVPISWLQLIGRQVDGVDGYSSATELRQSPVWVDAVLAVLEPDERTALRHQFEALGIVATVVCALSTVTVLVLALSGVERRRRELAVRIALGASHAQLWRAFLFETLSFSVPAVPTGWGIAAGFSRVLGEGVLAGGFVPRALPIAPSAPTVLITFIGGVLVASLVAAVATASAYRAVLWAYLGPGFGPRRARLRSYRRHILLACEGMLAGWLLALGVQTADQLSSVGGTLGFDLSRLTVVSIAIPPSTVPESEHLFRLLRERLALTADVEAAAFGPAPFEAATLARLVAVGSRVLTSRPPGVSVYYGEPSFPSVVSMARLEPQSNHNITAQDAAFVNDALVRGLGMKRADLIGERIQLDVHPDSTFHVAGVLADAHWEDPRRTSGPAVYLPIQAASRLLRTNRTLLLRSRGTNVATALALVRASNLLPDPAGVAVATGRALLLKALTPERLVGTLIGCLLVVALPLTAFCLYSTVAGTLAQAEAEFATRYALGAPRRWLVMRSLLPFAAPISAGGGLGAMCAVVLSPVVPAWVFSPGVGAAFSAWVLLMVATLPPAVIPALRALQHVPTSLRAG